LTALAQVNDQLLESDSFSDDSVHAMKLTRMLGPTEVAEYFPEPPDKTFLHVLCIPRAHENTFTSTDLVSFLADACCL
jgi:hypothetical protein